MSSAASDQGAPSVWMRHVSSFFRSGRFIQFLRMPIARQSTQFSNLEQVMAELVQAVPPSLPPHVELIQMGTGGAVAHVVHIAAKLGLADRLADGPRSAAELAGPLDLHAPSLHRLMRTIASLGLLTEGEAQRFSVTKLGEELKTGAPGSARATLLMTGSSWVG